MAEAMPPGRWGGGTGRPSRPASPALGHLNSPIGRSRRPGSAGCRMPLGIGSAMLDKTYRPAEIEARYDRRWQTGGWFARWTIPRRGLSASSYRRRTSPAACTWGTPSASPCRTPSRASPDAGPRGALAAGHRPRRHRDAERGRAPSSRGGGVPPRPRPRRASSSASGRGRRSTPADPDRQQLQRARRLRRLVARALHHGRRPSRAAVRKVFVELYRDGPDLPGQADDQLGRAAARPRSRDLEVEPADRRPAVPRSATRSMARPGIHGRDHAARDHARRHRRRGEPRGRALPPPGRRAKRLPPARRPRDLRSSPTPTVDLKFGHRRQDHARRTTPTTTRSGARHRPAR